MGKRSSGIVVLVTWKLCSAPIICEVPGLILEPDMCDPSIHKYRR